LLLFEKEISTFFPGCRELNLLQLCKINCCWPFSELNKDKDKDKDKEHCNINCRLNAFAVLSAATLMS